MYNLDSDIKYFYTIGLLTYHSMYISYCILEISFLGCTTLNNRVNVNLIIRRIDHNDSLQKYWTEACYHLL